MDPSYFKDLAIELNYGQPPRVWSLLVTVFGELAQSPGTKLSGQDLRDLVELIGIKPEATRVALHRLRKDGWLDAEKVGRTSHYFLTPAGREQSRLASPRIYAKETPSKEAWLIMRDNRHSQTDRDSAEIWINPHSQIVDTYPKDSSVFALPLQRDQKIPMWMRQRICNQDLADQSALLAESLANLLTDIRKTKLGEELHLNVLRVLVVHSWRRIVLKAPALPDFVFPDPWAGDRCRTLAAEILAELSSQTQT